MTVASTPYSLRDTMAAMVLEHDAGGITLATMREAREHLASTPSPAGVEGVAKLVYRAMVWAARAPERGQPPEWVERGNSSAQEEARAVAHAILATLSPSVNTKDTAREAGERCPVCGGPAWVEHTGSIMPGIGVPCDHDDDELAAIAGTADGVKA